MKRKFAISDIHGCAKTFVALLELIGFSTSDELFLLGDYIDRGPDSKGVIEHVFKLRNDGFTVHCLRGNHEQMMLDGAAESGNALSFWKQNGGLKTLKSYGVDYIQEMPDTHLQFFENLDWYFEIDEYILVHGGLDWFPPLAPLENKTQLIWARWWHNDIDYQWLKDRIIVHGHTPTYAKEIRLQLENLEKKQYLDIDSGCFMHQQKNDGYGFLCAFNMTNRKLFFQENIDYTEL